MKYTGPLTNKMNMIFLGLICYLLITGASTFYLLRWSSNEQTRWSAIRDLEVAALAFSEENYHTQLEIWEYAYEPSQKRRDAFLGHNVKFNELLQELKHIAVSTQQFRDSASEAKIVELEKIALEIEKSWNNILNVVDAKSSREKINKVIFESEDLLDHSAFNRKTAALIKSLKADGLYMQKSLMRSQWTVITITVLESVMGILLTLFSLWYIRRLEQRNLLQQQQIVSASKLSALGEMAGGIAHEINTPLTTISLQAELLMHELASEKSVRPAPHQKAELIYKTTDRIAKIITTLRAISRDGSKDPKKICSVPELIEDVANLCEQKLKNTGITLKRYNIAPASLECRPVDILQVMINLINNSCDAVSALKNKWIAVEVIDQGDQIEISVSDSGQGIPFDVSEKMFQPFFTTKEIGKGTGLGLSISRKIIADHGGKLWLDTHSLNTRFVITLPKSASKNPST